MTNKNKQPTGGWGGDLDPMAQQRRAMFEAQLQKQMENIMADKMPLPQPQPQPRENLASNMAIDKHPVPVEKNPGADLIAQLGQEHDRVEREARKLAEAMGEGPPVPEIPRVHPDAKKRSAMGHIPPSLQRELMQQQQAAPQQLKTDLAPTEDPPEKTSPGIDGQVVTLKQRNPQFMGLQLIISMNAFQDLINNVDSAELLWSIHKEIADLLPRVAARLKELTK